MKLAINLLLSLGMLALCMWLVWPDATVRAQLAAAFDAIDASVEHIHGAMDHTIDVGRPRLSRREAREHREIVHQPP